MPDPSTIFDYIVVGAGSAGATVAARLTEDPDTTVLLVEAGPEDRSYWSKIPLGFAKILFHPKYMWKHESEPELQLNGRTIPLPHGKVIGGSSTINGLVWVRGLPFDYDSWAAQGATGWSYEDVLPYFKKAEAWAEAGEAALHNTNGPIGVENARWKNPLAEAFIASAMETLDIGRNDDFNGAHRDGAGYWPLNTRNGERSGTSVAYIKPNRARANLHILTNAMVTRIVFEGRTATGIFYEQAGQTLGASARREIILSAGALQTPQLLQVSGVGPGDVLAAHGIPVVHELMGVGENLMDHVQTGPVFSTSSRDTLNIRVRNWLGQVLAGINYYVGPRNGPLTIGASLAGAYVRSRHGLPAPDIHLHYLPFTPGKKGWDLAKQSGFRLGFYPNRPESRGRVRIVSPDARVGPSVVFNHLSSENDMRILLDGMRIARKIGGAAPLKRYDVVEQAPGSLGDTEEGLRQYIRDTAATAFHYSGTARMGNDDGAVVDSALRVRGVERLRVIDASVMPTIVSGNTNPAVVMIAEKGADLVKAG